MLSTKQLYELSLSIGDSLDLRSNCERFASAALALPEITSAEVWLRHHLLIGEGSSSGEKAEEIAILIYGVPTDRFGKNRIPLHHPAFAKLAECPSISVDDNDPQYTQLNTETRLRRGVVTAFALGDMGFLRLHSSYKRSPFDAQELKDLTRVVNQFATSIEASLAHHQQVREVALRKRAEAALNHREERFRALIENALDLIFVLNYDATIVSASPSLKRALGYEPTELEGTNFFQLVHPDEVTDHFRTFLEQVKTPGIALPLEIRLRHNSSSWRVLEVSSNNLLSDSAVGGIILNCHDITNRKARAVELEEAKARAEEASRAKSDFVAHLSHEIRNPLNGVLGMATLLLDSELSDEQRDFADTIRASADSLGLIIEDTLDFAKIESGRVDLVHEPFSIVDCVEGCFDVVAPMLAGSTVDLAYSIDEGTPRSFIGDGARLRQILLNLLSNALKCTSEGEVVVTVRSEEVEPGEHNIQFSVRDTGIGVSDEQAERLFEPFIQGDQRLVRRGGGTGLGLTICKRLSELMGGKIWVERGSENGATFVFTVRCATAGEELGSATTRSALEGRRIVVVEKSGAHSDILTRYLSEQGMDVTLTCTVDDALQRMVADVDVALVGASLSSEEVHAPAVEIRAEFAELPIVVMRPLGVRVPDVVNPEGVILKPVKLTQLGSILARILGGSPEAEGTVAESPEAGVSPIAARKVLVADDDAISRKVARLMLARLGCRVELVEDGEQAVAAASEGAFDLVLMDLRLPGMDGIEATQALRKTLGEECPRIVALTAQATNKDRERCFAAGMDGWLTKPVELDRLRVEVERSEISGVPEPGAEVSEDLDGERLELLRQVGGQSLLDDLVGLFIDEQPERIEKIRHAAKRADATTIAELAHSIKGSCANLGVVRVGELAANLEDMGERSQLKGVRRCVADLERALDEVTPMLETIRNGSP